MKVPAKRALLEHADETLDDTTAELHRRAARAWSGVPDAVRAHLQAPPIVVRAANPADEEKLARATAGINRFLDENPDVRAEIHAKAFLAAMSPNHPPLPHASVSFVPGPPRPAPPPQDWPHANIVRRSIAGEDDDAVPRLPSLRGFLAAAAASDDWGVPVRSTSDPERFGKGALRGGGGRPHDPHTGREHYALAQRELVRIASELPMLYGLDGHEQMAVWATVAGAGRLERRNIHVGVSTDAIEREERRAAKQSKRRKRGTMQPPARRRAYMVPERKTMTATEVAAVLRGADAYVTPHQVGLICRRVTERVRAAFEAKGWIRAQTKSERTERETKGKTMATLNGYDLQGWKDILAIIGCSANTARALMTRKERRLPVTLYLGTPQARTAELRAWQDAEIAAAMDESADGADSSARSE